MSYLKELMKEWDTIQYYEKEQKKLDKARKVRERELGHPEDQEKLNTILKNAETVRNHYLSQGESIANERHDLYLQRNGVTNRKFFIQSNKKNQK